MPCIAAKPVATASAFGASRIALAISGAHPASVAAVAIIFLLMRFKKVSLGLHYFAMSRPTASAI